MSKPQSSTLPFRPPILEFSTQSLQFRKIQPSSPPSAMVKSNTSLKNEKSCNSSSSEEEEDSLEEDLEWNFHLSLLGPASAPQNAADTEAELLRSAPVFSGTSRPPTQAQFRLLARRLSFEEREQHDLLGRHKRPDPRIFLNVNTPWSAFICGSQGSGKSYNLSCMLENCLLQSEKANQLGDLQKPLAGLLFHYDRFTGSMGSQCCEAAFLSSRELPVKVLVSPSNFSTLKDMYSKLRGVSTPPRVEALLLKSEHLTIDRMKKLMAVQQASAEGRQPLYMEVVTKVLREMAKNRLSGRGIDYRAFKAQVLRECTVPGQLQPLSMRLDLLESFMDPSEGKPEMKPVWNKSAKSKEKKYDAFTFEPGSLTIIDLSCPFVDEASACAIFSIVLAIFLSVPQDGGRVVALDEAHRFMDESAAAADFTEDLLAVVRQQRHLATRVIVSTQEPTISPKFLDLCSMSFIHRFTSPAWMQALKEHLAGASSYLIDEDPKSKHSGMAVEIFNKIVRLKTGEALLFSPSAVFDRDQDDGRLQRLGMGNVKLRIRTRLTVDGGTTIFSVE